MTKQFEDEEPKRLEETLASLLTEEQQDQLSYCAAKMAQYTMQAIILILTGILNEAQTEVKQ